MPGECQAQDAPSRLGGADRVLLVLTTLARHPRGVTLEDLAREVGAPKPSVHRALATLGRAGLAEQYRRGGSYRIGLEFLRLAFAFYDDWDEQAAVQPALDALAQRFGETAHYARLEGAEIVYIAKVTPPVGGVRMSSIIGGRNPAHCTGVGKALLAHELSDRDAVERYNAQYGPLARRTETTIVDPGALHRELEVIRRTGYALDRQESEPGINCVAFPVFFASAQRPAGAISVAAVAQRTPLDVLAGAADEIRALITPLGAPGDARATNGRA